MILSISHAHLLNMPRPVIIPPLTISLLTECKLSFNNNTQWAHTYFSHLTINMQKWVSPWVPWCEWPHPWLAISTYNYLSNLFSFSSFGYSKNTILEPCDQSAFDHSGQNPYNKKCKMQNAKCKKKKKKIINLFCRYSRSKTPTIWLVKGILI